MSREEWIGPAVPELWTLFESADGKGVFKWLVATEDRADWHYDLHAAERAYEEACALHRAAGGVA